MPSRGEAFDFLNENAKEIFGSVSSMLYVGHRPDTHVWWRTTFAELIGLVPSAEGPPQIDIVDIVPGNLPYELVSEGHVRKCFHGDIRTCQAKEYGIVFWDEGPEHVTKEDAMRILKQLAEDNSHVLISCPWGYMPQGSGPDDPEFHHWGPQIADFEEIGFKARTFGTEFTGQAGDGRHGNLIAWV